MSNATNYGLKLEILLATMHRTSLDFLTHLFPESNYLNYNILIVNQTTKDKLLHSNYQNIRVINVFEKGLARSRNLAIKNTIGDLCLVADDDVKYKPNFDKVIINAFKNNKNAEVITFKMEDLNGNEFKPYTLQTKHDLETVKTVNSVVIAFKPEVLKRKQVLFNPNFGLGSIFKTGEEYVFLRLCLKRNLKLYFEPKTILAHDYNSSGRDAGSDRLVFARAAIYYKFSGFLGYLKLCKYLYLNSKMGFINRGELIKKFRVGLQGISKYKTLVKQQLETR